MEMYLNGQNIMSVVKVHRLQASATLYIRIF